MEDKLAYSGILHKIVESIIGKIDGKLQVLANRDLLTICGEAGFIGEGDAHLPHELIETAVNRLILGKYGNRLLSSDEPERMCRETLRPLCGRLPTQSWRSSNQIIRQQFSTPPAIAYLLAYLMNWRGDETILEPSAGTGSLAAWASCIGLETRVNEIDPRRREMLKLLGFSPTAHNAEFIHDLLPPDAHADCVIMNPPFSANSRCRNASKFGFRHVESALERLTSGGKFGIILGNAGGLDTKTGNDFWKRLSNQVSVRSIIRVDGREYYKHGTSVDINLITGRKLRAAGNRDWNAARKKIIQLSVDSVEDAFAAVRRLGLRLNK